MDKASPDCEAFCATCRVIPRAGLQTVQQCRGWHTLLPVQLILWILATRGKAQLWWAAIQQLDLGTKCTETGIVDASRARAGQQTVQRVAHAVTRATDTRFCTC